MKNKKLLIISIVVILVLVLGGGLTFYLLRDKRDVKTSVASSDAKKFKEEYESLNDTIRKSDGAKYNNMAISEDNPIKYIDAKEAVEVLKNKTGILYVGANWCPWCRNAVPVLFDVAKDRGIDIIYYLNLDNEKDTFEIKEGKLVKTKEGTEKYYELLEVLKDELNDYVLTGDDGKKYDTKEKRIYMPFVVTFKDGKVEATHTGTVDLNEDQNKYSPLTHEQYKELYEIYDNMVSTIYKKGICNDNCD